jgi:hypothetical protein
MASMVLGGLYPRVPNTKCECTFIDSNHTYATQHANYRVNTVVALPSGLLLASRNKNNNSKPQKVLPLNRFTQEPDK